MRFLKLLLFLPLTLCAYGGSVSYLAVSDENSYADVADFNNTYEININRHGTKEIGKCQAVRLDRNWYITAAHCVQPSCDESCSIQARLIVGKDHEMSITTSHSSKKPRIFKDPKSDVKNKNAAYDIALIYFKPSDSKIILRHPVTLTELTEQQFTARLPDASVYTRALYGTNLPKLMTINTSANSTVNRRFSVVSIWNGQRYFLSTTRPVFYSPKLHYMHTENFGVIQGISGSGVMTNTGELAGLVSATATLDYKDPKTDKDLKVNIIFIASFDEYVLEFIKKYVPSVSCKDAGDALMPVGGGYKEFTKNFDEAAKEIKK